MTGYEMIDKAIENLLYPFGKPKGAELKELLKNVEIGGGTDTEGKRYVFVTKNGISNITKKENEILGEWVREAMLEKYGRDFTELRWIKVPQGRDTYHICPKCERDEYVHTPNYCAGCGARLLPPEEEEE